MAEHARLLADWLGEDGGLRDFRKHTGWYLTGYPVGPQVRRRLAAVSSLDELDDLLATLDPAFEVVPGRRCGPIVVTPTGPDRSTSRTAGSMTPTTSRRSPSEADALVSGG